MPNTALIPALAKTLIAIAWADGELHPEEEVTLKEVVGLLPTISAQEWAVLELYLLTPITAEERVELVQLTRQHIRTATDKALALEALDNMLHADGAVHPGEAEVAHSIRDAFASVDVSALGVLGRVLGGAFRGRLEREEGLELWRSNPVIYLLHARNRIDASAEADPAVTIAALAVCVMAQVVRVSSATFEAERPVIVRALTTDWYIAPDQAELFADAALAVTRRNVDYHRVSRELARRTSEAQRVRLLDTLFAIANTADQVAPAEIDEIRIIADRLDLARPQFIAAKLKIPSADRAGL